MKLGLPHTADAVEESELVATATDLSFVVAGKLQQMAMADLNPKVIEQIAGKPMRVNVRIGKSAAAVAAAAKAPPSGAPAPAPESDAAAQRALENPEVQRFRELFPEGHVRQVRDLKE